MTQLVIIVVAAVWAAVVIPPLLRSRLENRPNSSVTDFRRQLSTLQGTSSPRMRTIGRPLAQSSPLQRPAAGGRPGASHHRQASLHGQVPSHSRSDGGPRPGEAHPTAPMQRSHGDPSGGHERPHRQMHVDRHTDGRRPSTQRPSSDTRAVVRRRRSNVLFLLVVVTACSLFLWVTTSSTALLYAFTLSLLALCGYVYQLTQLRRRETSGWRDGWLETQR